MYGREFTVYSDHKPLIYLYKLKNPSSKLTRIRLDLEEYKFDIVHISGKLNVVADALSRIAIDELKNQYDHEILAITRSMTKASNNTQIDTEKATQIQDVRVYESLHTGFDKKIPRIKLTKYLLKNDIVTHCAIQVNKNHRKVFDCEIRAKPPMKISFKDILKQLESKAKAHNFKILQWPLYDEVFIHCTVSDFKQSCIDTLKEITICLIQKTENILDKAKRRELLSTFHNVPLYGGHCGQKRLYANLRNKFYWPKMTKDVAKFINVMCVNFQNRKQKRESL